MLLFLLCFYSHLFIDALWSPAGKGLTSWLSFVMYNCISVTFLLVSWLTVSIPDLSLFLTLYEVGPHSSIFHCVAYKLLSCCFLR